MSLRTEYQDALLSDANLTNMFYCQAENYPDRIALSFNGREVRYDELNCESNQMAHLLGQIGVGKDDIVVILMERCVEAYTGMLGILKAGAAYLVIDPAYPTERIQYILKDSSPVCVLTKARYLPRAEDASKRFLVLVDKLRPFQKAKKRSGQVFDLQDISGAPSTNLPVINSGSDLAYVIYTSGSTGNPKGVMIEHRSVVNLVNWATETFNITHHSRIAQSYSITFDASVQEIWTAFTSGSTLYPVSEEIRINPHRFLLWLKENAISYWDTVPTLWYQIADYVRSNFRGEKWLFPDLEVLVLGGEALHGEALQTWMDCVEPTHRIFNVYGPTEATVSATYYSVSSDDNRYKIVPIGRSLPNLEVSVLDEELRPCPPNVKGEICIAGIALARGYLNRPELTESTFIIDERSGQRLYKTGDLGIPLPDGNIEFVGRKDEQVKIRGYRIELAEIEATLNDCPGVDHIVVGTVENEETKNKKLVAYYRASDKELTGDQIRAYVKEKLPAYMIPHHFVSMSVFPLTSSGKIDKKALAQIPISDASPRENAYQPPTTKTEKLLAKVWKEVLNIENIGINDDFFAFGGDSILSIIIRHRCEQEGISLQAVDILQHPTIGQLAHYIETHTQLNRPIASPKLTLAGHVAQPIQDQVLISLSPEQQKLLPPNTEQVLPLRGIQKIILDQSSRYTRINQEQVILECEGTLDLVAFEEAINLLISRHEALRMIFRTDIMPEPIQIILSDANYQVVFHDLTVPNPALPVDVSRISSEELDNYIRQVAEEEFERRLSLAQAPLFKFLIYKRDEKRFDIVWTRHYIIMDGWSTANFVKELGLAYSSLVAKRVPRLPSLKSNFSDIVKRYPHQAIEQASRFWKSELSNMTFLELPKETQNKPGWFVKSQSFSLDYEQTEKLKMFAKAHGMTINTICLSAYYLMLKQVSKLDDLTSGVVVSGRTNSAVDIVNVIGSLINIVPLRIKMERLEPMESLVQIVKEKLLQALRYSDLDVLQIANIASPNGRQLPFETVFVFENYPSPVKPGLGYFQTFQITGMIEKENTGYPLVVVAYFEDETLHFSFEYASHLFTEETMRNWSNIFLNGISQIL